MSQQQWSFNFGPGFISPEELKAQQEKQQQELQRMVDEKQCVLCNHAILINDVVAICNAKECNRSGQCVDGQNGVDCEYWEIVENLKL